VAHRIAVVLHRVGPTSWPAILAAAQSPGAALVGAVIGVG
jgi:hypothetical protein